MNPVRSIGYLSPSQAGKPVSGVMGGFLPQSQAGLAPMPSRRYPGAISSPSALGGPYTGPSGTLGYPAKTAPPSSWADMRMLQGSPTGPSSPLGYPAKTAAPSSWADMLRFQGSPGAGYRGGPVAGAGLGMPAGTISPGFINPAILKILQGMQISNMPSRPPMPQPTGQVSQTAGMGMPAGTITPGTINPDILRRLGILPYANSSIGAGY